MALETPNAIVASLVLLADQSQAVPDVVSLRSSTGILRKVSEVPSPIAGEGVLVTFELEHPVDNDEGMAIAQFIEFGGPLGSVSCFPWISPLAKQLGVPQIDDIPPNLLVALIGFSAAPPPFIKARVPILVFGQQTTAPAISGEPLP